MIKTKITYIYPDNFAMNGLTCRLKSEVFCLSISEFETFSKFKNIIVEAI